MNAPGQNPDPAVADKELPLREDIRLLGRLLGDTLREQEGERLFDSHRAHPPDRHPLPPRRRPGRRARTRGHAQRADPVRTIAVVRAFSYLLAARQHRRGPAPQPAAPRARCWPARRRRKAAWRCALARARDGRRGREDRSRDFFRDALISPVLTAHPDRSAAQEHSRLPARDRAAARRARPARADAGGARAQRGVAAARDPDAVADAHPARAAADRARRDRERAVLLPLYVPARSCRACTARSKTCWRSNGRTPASASANSSPGHLDRRRPRRQSLRHARRHAPGARCASRPPRSTST